MRTTFTARKRLIQGLAHHETEGFNPRFPYHKKPAAGEFPHLPEYTIRFCAEYAIIYAFGWRAPALYLPFFCATRAASSASSFARCASARAFASSYIAAISS